MLKTETLTNQNTLKRKAIVSAAAGFSAVAAAVGVANMNNPPSVPKPGEAQKVYTVKPNDTAWTISEKAYPNSDPRPTADMITKEAGSVLTPGEKIALPHNSQIGAEVDGDNLESSGG